VALALLALRRRALLMTTRALMTCALMARVPLVLVMLAQLSPVFVFAPQCAGVLDCSLNGNCVAGRCVCGAGWAGPSCALLDLEPAVHGEGLLSINSSNSSWGNIKNRARICFVIFHWCGSWSYCSRRPPPDQCSIVAASTTCALYTYCCATSSPECNGIARRAQGGSSHWLAWRQELLTRSG
jgi:hypothetical protein